MILKKFKYTIDGMGTTSVSVRIDYLCTMLRGESQQKFYWLVSHNSGTTSTHLKHIQEGLLGFFIDAISKQKHMIRRAMRKPRNFLFKIFSAQLMDLNN